MDELPSTLTYNDRPSSDTASLLGSLPTQVGALTWPVTGLIAITLLPSRPFELEIETYSRPATESKTMSPARSASRRTAGATETMALNSAVHAFALVIVTTPSAQSSSPDHPAKTDSESAVAVRVTTVPAAKSAVHLEPHEMPPGDAVTVPAPVPYLSTRSRSLAAAAGAASTM